MFLEIEDLKNVIYGYQIDQITEQDKNITLQAIAAAEQEVRSYLSPSTKKAVRYDIEAIMSATGDQRNAIILSHMATIAKYYIIELCNVDIIYETAKDRYDRAVSWLKMLSKGDISLDSLPTIDDPTPGTGDDDTYPFVYGSREKFNHE